MSASPGDAQPVFEAIARRAKAFCEADGVGVVLLEDGMLHLRTQAGLTGVAAQNYEAAFPRPSDNSTMVGRAIFARDAVCSPDFMADPDYALTNFSLVIGLAIGGRGAFAAGWRTIGAIGLGRFDPAPGPTRRWNC